MNLEQQQWKAAARTLASILLGVAPPKEDTPIQLLDRALKDPHIPLLVFGHGLYTSEDVLAKKRDSDVFFPTMNILLVPPDQREVGRKVTSSPKDLPLVAQWIFHSKESVVVIRRWLERMEENYDTLIQRRQEIENGSTTAFASEPTESSSSPVPENHPEPRATS